LSFIYIFKENKPRFIFVIAMKNFDYAKRANEYFDLSAPKYIIYF